MAAANRNKVGTPFQYAESPFAALAVVKSMTGLKHLQDLKYANIHEDLKSSHTAARIAPFKSKPSRARILRGWPATLGG